MSSGPINVLNVAEKPSVARGITEILGRGRASKSPGFSPTNPVWQFDYQIDSRQCNMIVTSVSGHLQGFVVPSEIENNWNIDPSILFECQISKITPEDKKPLQRTLEREVRKCQWLILWLDCDREGENIAFEVINVCTAVRKNLRILRAKFSALIPKDIIQCVTKLVTPNKNEADAVDARQEIDLRVGFAFTRFQSIRWRRKFDELRNGPPISYGGCQFPTLGFVVDQYWKHKHFIPEPFWYLKLVLEKEGIQAHPSWKRHRIYDFTSCLVLYECVMEAPVQATIVHVQNHSKRKLKPLPLTTVELQKDMSRFERLSAHEAMNIAEKLYQDGFISYPRTETDGFPASFDFRPFIEQHYSSSKWGEYAQQLNQGGKFRMPRRGSHDDQSHPPIHPIKFDGETLSGAPAKLYEYVVRRFLACCSEDAVGSETVVEIAVKNEAFSCVGLSIQERNFLEIYPYASWGNNRIPNFQIGEVLTPKQLTMEQGTTTAPPLLTEADLIQLMNQNGIGTDATIAEHINTIVQRQYVVKSGSRNEFSPTKLGEALVAGYNFIGHRKLNQPQLRAYMESELKRICLGQVTKDQVVGAIVASYKKTFAEVRAVATKLDRALERYFSQFGAEVATENPRFSRCGKCGGNLTLSTTHAGGHFLSCPVCSTTFPLPIGTISAFIPSQNNTFLCKICSFQVVHVTTPKGKEFNVCPNCFSNPPQLYLDQIESIGSNLNGTTSSMPSNMLCFKCTESSCPLSGGTLSLDHLPVRKCPHCSRLMVIKKSKEGPYRLSCTGYPNCIKTLWFPRDRVKSVTPTNVQCPSCQDHPSMIVKIEYEERQVFETDLKEEEGCLKGHNFNFTNLLAESNHNFESWETSAPPINSIQLNHANSQKNKASAAFSKPGAGGTAITSKRKTPAGSSNNFGASTATKYSKNAGGAKKSSASHVYNKNSTSNSNPSWKGKHYNSPASFNDSSSSSTANNTSALSRNQVSKNNNSTLGNNRPPGVNSGNSNPWSS